MSLSARRAWIEIIQSPCPSTARCVALRKESVDRNSIEDAVKLFYNLSLSARRAWIEIIMTNWTIEKTTKSLSARRAWIEISTLFKSCSRIGRRSPQGERG